MFRSEILWVENKRSKLWKRMRKFFGKLFLFAFVGSGVWGGLYFAGSIRSRSARPVLIEIAPTATFSPVYREPASQVIDGLLTYGLDQPLAKEELNGLIEFLNAAPATLDEDAYYVTFLASEMAYRAFFGDYGESLPSYLLRHVVWMNRELKEANPPVDGGLVARRLVVVADSAFESDDSEWYIPGHHYSSWSVRGYDYLAQGFLDSDGAWSFIEPYYPAGGAYYNVELGLDTGLLHEWSHSILKLPDHYGLDFHPQYTLATSPWILQGVPADWHFYSAGGRPDLSRGDFSAGGGGAITLRHYSALQLADRRARRVNHDVWRSLGENGFPARVPGSVIFEFGPDYAEAEVQIYRSQRCPPEHPDREATACKVLNPVPTVGRLDVRGRFDAANLFAGYEELVPVWEGVLLIKVIQKEEVWFRWMDIRDFVLPVWEGFGESVVMKFNLTSASDDPALFVWDVEYERITVTEPSLPN